MTSWRMDSWNYSIPKEYRGKTINLLTPNELRGLAPDQMVVSILGKVEKAGNLNAKREDLRYGHTAWGLLVDE